MTERLIAPTDELTGIPLPIAPRSDLVHVPDTQKNAHHHFFPRTSPVLQSLGGKALRSARIQLVAATQHNTGPKSFHSFFREGPYIPSDVNEQLGLCILACANYLPERVVDLRGGAPLVRPMADWEYRRLSQPGMFEEPKPFQVKRFRDIRHPDLPLWEAKQRLVVKRQQQAELSYRDLWYGFDPMRSFIIPEVFSHASRGIDMSLERRFLNNDNVEAGLALLSIYASMTSRAATIKGKPANQIYFEMKKEHRLHHLMPPSASAIVRNKMGDEHQRASLLPSLRAKLLDNADSDVA